MQKKPIKRVILTFLLICACHFLAAGTAGSAEQPDFKALVGKWARTDGSYTLRIKDVKQDGTVDAGYFNPKEIHIAEATVSDREGLVKLFIRFQDEGYPGSTYTLYYYAEKDALAGFYYQAVMKQTFEVVFIRE